jgi:hypothetical protein
MVLFKHLARVTTHLGAVSCVSWVLNAQNKAHCVGGKNQLSPVSLPTLYSLPSLPASSSSNVRFSYVQRGTGMFGSSAVLQALPLNQVALQSMSAFPFQASLPAFIAPAGTATGLHAPASAASLPAFIAPAGTATGLHASSAIHSAANSDAAVVAAEFPTPLVQSPVVVTMANIAPDTVTLPHLRFSELVAKAAAYDEAQRKADEAQLQATQDAISASNPPPPKFLSDFTDECHLAATYPGLKGDLSIFCPTNYRSRHSQTDPNWRILQGHNFSRAQKIWFCGQLLEEDLINYRTGSTRKEFCKRYSIPYTTAMTWKDHFLSERSFKPNLHVRAVDRTVPLFTMNHDGIGRPCKMSIPKLLEGFKEIKEGTVTDRGGEKHTKSHLEVQEINVIFKRYEDHPYILRFVLVFQS